MNAKTNAKARQQKTSTRSIGVGIEGWATNHNATIVRSRKVRSVASGFEGWATNHNQTMI